ncbi:baseplate J/gp47 family protein [Solirubrobacter ginsenosidimutans]|uniref:Baseplate J/gp47 family protein n=1 Tax=Solirubrobacter ginsenosidimutans TaxID=490573 RepID=A0A9X3MTB3_9ACTN|nr:hypothetical protein [Solirubrobacter ginsenosidimutans]MDA0160863.1 baseplate J/gp47 family protein [Solirubrobacter ginsenosidimutans]
MSDVQDVLAIDAEAIRSTASEGFGITGTGFVPKSFARLLTEKLATARLLFGDDVDLASGSVLRKVLELAALEDARLWAAVGSVYDDGYVVSARGAALSRLGEDLGIARPHEPARGHVTLKLKAKLPAGRDRLTLTRGARLSTAGGHHVALDETVVLTAAAPERTPAVVAFHPGPSHNLSPAAPNQKIDRFNRADAALMELEAAEQEAGEELVDIVHTEPLTGGELQWPDARYRALLLRAPRSLWTVAAVEQAVALVAGVRQVQVFDGRGGLDITQSIYGNFNFIERLFNAERDLGNPYYFSVLVAPTPAAIWEGPDGLKAAVETALDDLRPIGIYAAVERAEEVGVSVDAKLVVRGLPLPTGSRDAVNASPAARELRMRLYARLRAYVDQLAVGEPVRSSEVVWAIMNEPGIADVRDVHLVRHPAEVSSLDLSVTPTGSSLQRLGCGENVELQSSEIPAFVDMDDPRPFEIV